MKTVYEHPELWVTLFLTNDVLTTSDNDVDIGDLGWLEVDGSLTLNS